MAFELPPYVPMLVAAALVPFVPRRVRDVLMLLAPAASFAALMAWPGVVSGAAAVHAITLGGIPLTTCAITGIGAVFAGLFCVAAFLAALYSLHVEDRTQPATALVYAASAVGAVVAGDLVTMFVWVEAMAVASVFQIWARGGERALRAGWRYLLWQLASGLLLLAGALVRFDATGSAAIVPIGPEDPGFVLLLLAFGIKAAFPFAHVWLTDAYPEATPTGTVWLSAFTTKVGVYALACQFAGVEALVWIGGAMACFPIFYAVIENDLRRVLAYSLVNQVGFMVCGIGIGSELGLAGAVAHACNDVVFKGLLFMTMGAVLHQTGRIGGNELGGLWRTMPRTTAFCLVGAASISAFPLFSGFVSKAMVMTAALNADYDVLWLLLLFASAGVFHHAGIKIPFFAFFAHDSGLRPAEPPRNMQLAMALAATLCIVVGCVPTLLYRVLPWQVGYEPYDVTHVVTQLQLLFWSAMAFAWLQRTGLYPPELPSTNLDADWVFRRGGPRALARLGGAIASRTDAADARLARLGDRIWRGMLRAHGPRGVLARTWPTESSMLWMAVLLGVLLILYYR